VHLLGYYLDKPNCEQVPYNRTAVLVVLWAVPKSTVNSTVLVPWKNGTAVVPWYRPTLLYC